MRNARTLAAMLDALSDVGAEHALFGGLLTGCYGSERPTTDVDLLVSRNAIAPLETAIVRRGYDVQRFRFLTKIYIPGDPVSVGDFVIHETNAVLRASFAATTPATILGRRVNAVRRGVFVALKFESSVSPRRPQKDRARDVFDIRGVIEKGFGSDDAELAAQISGAMYPGAVADLASLLDDLRRGRWPRVARQVETRAALLRRSGLAPLQLRRAR